MRTVQLFHKAGPSTSTVVQFMDWVAIQLLKFHIIEEEDTIINLSWDNDGSATYKVMQ